MQVKLDTCWVFYRYNLTLLNVVILVAMHLPSTLLGGSQGDNSLLLGMKTCSRWAGEIQTKHQNGTKKAI